MTAGTTKTPSGAHAKRLAKWRNLAPPQTRLVIDITLERLVPPLESAGFERVDFNHRDPEFPTSGSEIVLERAANQYLDSVTFNFEKHRTPRVQVQCSRRELTQPHKILRSANLVARSSQYYYFWGKPWWLPTSLWSPRSTNAALELAKSKLPQITRYLETGERGANISKEVQLAAQLGAA